MDFGGAIGLRYVSRGDPAAWDWTAATLTADSTWRTISLAAIIPANAKLVHLRLWGGILDGGFVLGIKKVGIANNVNVLTISTSGVGLNEFDEGIVVCTGQQVSYFATAGAWDNLGIVVLGWFV